MIIYRSDKAGFARDVDAGEIDAILLQNLKERRGFGVGPSEVRSWHQSLSHMRTRGEEVRPRRHRRAQAMGDCRAYRYGRSGAH